MNRRDALALLPLLFSGCAGYRIGTRSLYRVDLRTVHVPMIESDSFRRNLGERLTEAVVKELELNSPYKVVGASEGADSILRCRIISDQKRVIAETRTDEQRANTLALVVHIDWVDQRGQSLIQRSEIPLPANLLSISQAAHMVAEGGQSVATAHQAAIDQLAHQIVQQLEAAW